MSAADRTPSTPTRQRPPRILISHGDQRGHINLGDLAMLINVVRKLHAAIPNAEIRLLGVEHPGQWNLKETYVPEGIAYFDAPFEGGWAEFPVRVWRRLGLLGDRRPSILRRKLAENWYLPLLPTSMVARGCHRLGVLMENLRWTDVLVETGHGGFNDLFFEPDIADKLFVIRQAKKLGKSVVLTAHGYGPLDNRAIYDVMKRSLEGVNFIGARANQGMTWDLVNGFGLKSPKPVYSGDDAGDLPDAPAQRIDQILADEGVPRGVPLMAIHIRARRAGGGTNQAPRIAAMLDRVVDEIGHHLVFVSTLHKHTRADENGNREVFALMKRQDKATVLQREYTSHEARGVVGRASLAIGMGYHFAVFCLNQGVPCMVFSSSSYYDGKAGGLLAHFGIPDWLRPFDDIGSDAAIDLLKRGLSDGALRQRVRDGAEDWRWRTMLPIKAVAEALGVEPAINIPDHRPGSRPTPAGATA